MDDQKEKKLNLSTEKLSGMHTVGFKKEFGEVPLVTVSDPSCNLSDGE
jgi:hypothetical protein